MMTMKVAMLAALIATSSMAAGKLTYDFVNDPVTGPLFFRDLYYANPAVSGD